jgi:3-phytase
MRSTFVCMYAALAVFPAAVSAQEAASPLPLIEIPAFSETVSVQQRGDAADDPEIWRNAAEPAKSLIFVTDKKTGLFVLDLAGQPINTFPVGRLNNIDLRDGWNADGKNLVLAGVSDRTRLGITFFQLDPATLAVSHLADSFIQTDLGDPYGLCMYRSRTSNTLYAFVSGKDGSVRQYALSPRAGGGVDSRLERSFEVGSTAEGCVADDRTGILYFAEEARGVWRYSAEPSGGDARTLIAGVDGVNLIPDLEGLTLAPEGENGGRLVLSVQGDSAFAVISLPDEKLTGRFRITANPDKGVDEVTETDGVAVSLGDFGPDFPGGLLVTQDDANGVGEAQNFKLIQWDKVIGALKAGR